MSLFDDASLIVTPNGYKAGKLYSIKPDTGAGDLDVVRATSATRVDENGLIESVGNNVPRIDYPPLGGCPSILIEGEIGMKDADNIFLESATALIGQNSGAVGFICDFASPTEVHFMGENFTVTDDFILFEYSPSFVKYFKNNVLTSQKNGTFDFSGMDRIDLGSYEQTAYLNDRIKLIYLK